jgi:hypothetical protein
MVLVSDVLSATEIYKITLEKQLSNGNKKPW